MGDGMPGSNASAALPLWLVAVGVVASLLVGAVAGGALALAQARRIAERRLDALRTMHVTHIARLEAPTLRLDPGLEVEGRLGRGPRGEVYRVRRASDGKRLACKTLPPSEASSFLRITRESAILERLAHPRLLGRRGVGIEGDRPYLLSDLCEGPSLAEARLHFGDVPWALERLEEIADGLAALHENGIFHNNLKPENVLLGPGGHALLADVGLAPLDPSAIGFAADVHALGLLAEELLTRARTGEGVAATGGLPRHIARMLSACVAVDPAKRPRASDVHRTLQLTACSIAVA